MSEDFFVIIEKIRNLKGLKSEAQVAKVLGMTKNNLYSYKKRGVIPIKAVHTFCLREGISIDSLLKDDILGAPPRELPDQVTLRDILKLREDINELTKAFGKEIGDLKGDCIDILQRLNEAAESGDIKRLGIVGGKGS